MMPYMSEEFPTFYIQEDTGDIHINGVSLMDVAKDFYQPIMETVKEYIKTNPSRINIYAKLQYFNTPSSKYLLDMFKQFVPLHENGNEVKVYWYYEEDDDDMHEAGIDFNALVKIPFELVPIKFVREKDKEE